TGGRAVAAATTARIGEVRCVGKVYRLSPDLEAEALGKPEGAGKPRIHVEDARPEERVKRGRAKALFRDPRGSFQSGDARESCCVEPCRLRSDVAGNFDRR